MPALWLALALLATDGDGLRFEGSVTAGGGYDSNLLVAPGEDGAGSAVATLAANGGASVDLSDALVLHVGATLDGTRFATLSELDRTSAGAGATLLVDVVGPLAVVVGATGAYGWFADPARSGATVIGRATLRWRPSPWLTTRAGYAHVERTAVDPVYAARYDRLLAELEFHPARATWISLAAFVERGTSTYYRELLPATYEPYQAPSTTTGLGLGFEQGLGGGFSVDLGASWRRTGTPDGVYTGPSASAAITWRLD